MIDSLIDWLNKMKLYWLIYCRELATNCLFDSFRVLAPSDWLNWLIINWLDDCHIIEKIDWLVNRSIH